MNAHFPQNQVARSEGYNLGNFQVHFGQLTDNQ